MSPKQRKALDKLDAAIAARYAARDRYLASGSQADALAHAQAVKAQDEASAELAKLGL